MFTSPSASFLASSSDVDARQTGLGAEKPPRNFLHPIRAVSDERAQLEAISGIDAATLAQLTALDASESSPHVSWPPRFVSPSRGAASWSTSTPRASRRELSFGAAPRAAGRPMPGGSIGGVRSPSGAAGRGRGRKRASARVKTATLFGEAAEASSSSNELRRSDRAIARLTQQLQDARLVAREARIANSKCKRARERARAAAGGAPLEEPEILGKGLSTAPYLFAAVGQLIAIEREQTTLIRALTLVSRAHRVASGVEARRTLARADAEWRSLEAGIAKRAPFPSATRMESVQKVTGCFEQKCLRLL